MKIGNLDISAFKVGSSDCKIYLGDTLLYPTTPPTPTLPNYLRFVARQDGSFRLSGNTVEYSLDSGTTWASLASNTESPTVSSGSIIMWKSTNPSLVTNNGIGRFYATCNFDVEGNIMSLVAGDNFETATTISNDGQFRSLFDGNTNIINASGMTLPSTNVLANGYRSMFANCTNLVTAPATLPATTLGESCYKYMFRYCQLTTAPTLPATSLVQSCYADMFQGCTSLTTAPELPATTLPQQCYEYMFSGCTSLTATSEISATTFGDKCCRGMFSGCTNLTAATGSIGTSSATMGLSACTNMFQACVSLTVAPELPATTLALSCYKNMFQGCNSLTTAPSVLPATTLATNCYQYMFQNCTSLTTAPELPATTLVSGCYQYMFRGCTSLNYIKCLATDISAASCTNGWLFGVASTGTFTKAASMSSWTTGVNGIPSGWAVEDDIQVLQWKQYNEGDTIPSDLDVYGVVV